MNLLSGLTRKTVNILASAFSLLALGLLLYGGLINVQQTMDTRSVATGVNMALINGTLPLMAIAAILVELRSLWKIIRRPAAAFHKGQG